MIHYKPTVCCEPIICCEPDLCFGAECARFMFVMPGTLLLSQKFILSQVCVVSQNYVGGQSELELCLVSM